MLDLLHTLTYVDLHWSRCWSRWSSNVEKTVELSNARAAAAAFSCWRCQERSSKSLDFCPAMENPPLQSKRYHKTLSQTMLLWHPTKKDGQWHLKNNSIESHASKPSSIPSRAMKLYKVRLGHHFPELLLGIWRFCSEAIETSKFGDVWKGEGSNHCTGQWSLSLWGCKLQAGAGIYPNDPEWMYHQNQSFCMAACLDSTDRKYHRPLKFL